MSFLKIKDPAKRDAIVKEYLDLKKNIRSNLLSERTGEMDMQTDLSKFFKPITEAQKETAKEITEAQKATAKEITEGLKPIMEGIEGAAPLQAISFPAFPSIVASKEDIINLGPVAVKALKKPFTREGIDINFGLYDKDGEFYIGDTPAVIKDNNIIVGEEEYLGTSGLWELISSKNPKKFNDEDFRKYKDLLTRTNAIYYGNNPNQNRAKSNYQEPKWEGIVEPIWDDIITEKEFREGRKIRKKKTKGKGVTVIIPEDPNALLERLDLLLASQEAGHTGVGNELVSICDELKRQRVINADTYKKLNSYIKI